MVVDAGGGGGGWWVVAADGAPYRRPRMRVCSTKKMVQGETVKCPLVTVLLTWSFFTNGSGVYPYTQNKHVSPLYPALGAHTATMSQPQSTQTPSSHQMLSLSPAARAALESNVYLARHELTVCVLCQSAKGLDVAPPS